MRYILLTIFLISSLNCAAEGPGSQLLSDFTDVFSMEIFIQGFAFTACLTVGLFILLTDQRVHFSGVKDFGSFTWKLKLLVIAYLNRISLGTIFETPKKDTKIEDFRVVLIIRMLGMAIGFLLLIMISGVIVNTSSDSWMREGSGYHLGLKDIWRNGHMRAVEESHHIKTPDAIKVLVFKQVYKDVAIGTASEPGYFKQINEFYYQAWHELVSEETWREYVLSTHNLIDITESFALSFFVLFVLAYINFLINLYRDFFTRTRESVRAIFLPFAFFLGLNIASFLLENPFWITGILLLIPALAQFMISVIFDDTHKGVRAEVNSYYSLTSILIIYLSCAGYLLSSVAYIENNKLLCRKTFGVYRYVNPELRRMTREGYPLIIPGYHLTDSLQKQEVKKGGKKGGLQK